jgi:hypothetical protein
MKSASTAKKPAKKNTKHLPVIDYETIRSEYLTGAPAVPITITITGNLAAALHSIAAGHDEKTTEEFLHAFLVEQSAFLISEVGCTSHIERNSYPVEGEWLRA